MTMILDTAKYRTAYIVAALAAATVLAGCSEDDTKAVGHARTTLEYASMKDIRDINPHLYLGEMAAQAMVFESLVANTREGVRPHLAEGWDISPDGLTYTFHLRRGVRFSDGEPFNAEAVKLNFDAVLANRTRHAWLDLVNAVQSNEVVDEHTWRLRLRHPYFPTLIELGLSRPFRFVSPRCMRSGSSKDGLSCLAGTGPWMLAEHKRNQYALFKANPSYWGTRPKLEAVRWNVLPDPQAILMALEKGEVDLVFGADGDQLTSDALAALGREKKLTVAVSDPIASRAILLNSKRPITGEKAVREAIQRAVDRRAIVRGVLNDIEAPAPLLFAKNVPYCDIGLQERDFNLDEARRLLDSAGWRPGRDGVREKDGRRCEVAFYFNSQNAQERAIAEVVQAQLAEVGIAVRVIGEEKQAFLDRQRNGEFDLQYSLSWGAPYDPQSYFSSWRLPAHGDYQAQVGLPEKAAIDAAIGRFLSTNSVPQQQAAAREALTLVHESAVYLPISYSRTKAVFRSTLKGVGFSVSQYEIPFEHMYFQSAQTDSE